MGNVLCQSTDINSFILCAYPVDFVMRLTTEIAKLLHKVH